MARRESAHVVFFKTLPQNFIDVEGGMYGFGRFVFGVSKKLGSGNLLYGGEAYHDNGPWVNEDNFYKFNGLITYSQGDDAKGFSITARAYESPRWNSSDQLPYTAIPVVGFFGALNPTDGGRSQRYSLQGEWHHQGANSETKLMAYGFYYDLDLFSDFTYYLNDPYKGDQFEQQDRRWVAGFDLRHSIFGQFLAARRKPRSACSSATIGSTTAFSGRKIACVRAKLYHQLEPTPPPVELAVLPAATDIE